MPAVQYPFIDIAVHERVRDHFARGEAIVLFSADLSDVLWANGAGARLFGRPVLYDLIEDGPNPNDVTFRQVEATGRQLKADGDTRRFLIRIPTGFQRVAVQAIVERIRLTQHVDALLFAAPVSATPQKIERIAADMLTGFDDPDTHMAVLSDTGEVLAASTGFSRLGLAASTARTLVDMADRHPERLVKRPIPTGKGYLPAAIGKVSDTPAMHLLFAVETILGNMGPSSGFPEESPEPAPARTAETTEEPADSVMEGMEPSATPDMDGTVLADPVTAPALDAEPAPATEMAPLPVVEDLAGENLVDIPVSTAAETTGDAIGDVLSSSVTDGRMEDEAQVPQDPPSAAASQDEITGIDRDRHGEPALPAAEQPAPAAIVEDEVFRPNPTARPTRFVWKIDAEGHFSEVSPELAAAVGPHAADLSGVAFTDIASLLDLDPDGKIAELLGRRDTWSGKTIYWPVEGTNLKAPVDLAALPTYRRNREFDGFRGFGIVRLSDAVEDPQGIGLTLGARAEDAVAEPDAAGEAFHLPEDTVSFSEPEPASPSEEHGEETATNDLDHVAEQGETVPEAGGASVEEEDSHAAPSEDATALAETESTSDASAPVQDEPADETAEPASEGSDLRPEPPVFRASTPPLASSDKIIKLAEHRMRGRDGLTPGEQEAFREIARQLEPFRRDESAEEPSSAETGDAPEIAGDEGQDAQALPAALQQETAPSDRPDPAAVAPETGIAAHAPDEDAGEAQGEAAAAPAAAEADGEDDSHVTEQLEILASSIPARTAMAGGLSAEAIDAIPVALLVHAGEQIIHANPEFLRLTGYASVADLEAVGGLDALLHHRDLEDMPERSGGLSLVKADDSLMPVTARLQSVRWQDANALMLALIPSGPRSPEKPVSTDTLPDPDEERLTARVAELEVEVDELRSILETATDGVVIIGQEGEIRSMNRSASALFDYDETETRGKPFVMLFAHESHRAVADYLAGMTGHGVASVLNDGREVIGREASGGFIPLFMTIGRLSASNGYCAVIRDITQWKRTEEDLKNAKRAAETANAHKSDFLARVSHEIRTPLNAIIGFSDMMSIEHFGPIGHPRYVEYANDIARSGRLVLDIVNDLLDISKIEAGEMDLEFTAVGLNEAVSEAVSLVQPQAQANRVIIRTAFSESVPEVVADLRSIKQIVLNILSNGIRFTQPGGQIVVSTAYEPNGSVVLRIRDTGVGMTRSELEQAMKPFRQVTPGTRKRGDGTGLGLPLTKAMVDANRATFSINSAPNEGTLVEITFPSPRVLAN